MTLPPRIDDWPEQLREEWDERAAIVEYDAHLPRAEAERVAERIVREKYERRER